MPIAQRIKVAGSALWNQEAAGAMKDLIADFGTDVVHAHKLYVQLSVSPLVVAARRNLPIVQTLHDYELMSASPLDDTGSWLDRDESRVSYRALNTATYAIRRLVHSHLVAAWICPSRFLAERYAAHGIDAHVMPHFIEPAEPFRPWKESSHRSGAVFIGRLTRAKGVLDVIEVAKILPDISITIAGDGPLANEVRRKSNRMANLEFVGFAERGRVISLLRSARVALMPSRWPEPAGLVALEAMAAATPVVTYPTGGLAEYVRNAGGGRVVPEQPEALAAACAELHDDDAAWQRLSQAGVQAVADVHAIDPYVERLEGIYRAVQG